MCRTLYSVRLLYIANISYLPLYITSILSIYSIIGILECIYTHSIHNITLILPYIVLPYNITLYYPNISIILLFTITTYL